MLTSMLMVGTKIEQRFLIEADMEITGLSISFATYKRNIDSIVTLELIDGFNTILFSKNINTFNDNIYTQIETPNIKLTGGMYYTMMFIGHSNNVANAVSLWYDKKDGDTLKINSKLRQNCSINFKFDVMQMKEKSDTIESIAVENPVKRRGRPRKTI